MSNVTTEAPSYTILHIDSSPLGERSVSRKLTAEVLAGLRAKHPGATVISHDFGAHPLPHLSGAVLAAFFTPPEQRDAGLQAAIAASDQAVDELLAADTVIIGAPMWNFGIPSSLKAWVDHIVRAGRTFKYGAAGPEPLLPPGKKAIIVSSRGGIYGEGPAKSLDFQEDYLKTVLGFIGFTDVAFVRAEGVAYGEEAARKAVLAAQAQVADLVKAVA